jgi:hypothetical protein
VDDVARKGHESIRAAVAKCKRPALVIEMLRMLGDVLHSTLVVRHYRKVTDHAIVWAIGERYAEEFSTWTPADLGPHVIAPLPDAPWYPADAPYRKAWVYEAKKLRGVARAFGCGVHPWGCPHPNIVDAILRNAGITKLASTRRPTFPITDEDRSWAVRFIERHGLSGGFVTLEYVSYSLGSQPSSWYEGLVQALGVPVVALGASDDPPVAGAIDGRGTTFRQAKALMNRSRVFVGCGSGLSVIAASIGSEMPTLELVSPHISMEGLGYKAEGRKHAIVAPPDQHRIVEVALALFRG